MPTKRKKPTPIKVYRDDWNGLALMKLEGGFKPFRLSARKCEAILQVIDELKAFVEEQRKLEEVRISKVATPEELAIIAKYIPDPHPTLDPNGNMA